MAVGGAYYFVGQTVGGTVPGNTTFGGQILASDGLVGAPSISFSNHATSGLYWDSGHGGGLGFSNQGVEFMYFDNTNGGIVFRPGGGTGVLFKNLGTNTLYIQTGDGAAYTVVSATAFNAIARSSTAGNAGFQNNSGGSGLYGDANTCGLSAGGVSGFLMDSNQRTSALKQQVASKPASYPVVAADSYTAFDNTGASGSTTYTLPAIAAGTLGMRLGFTVAAAFTIVVTANAADKIGSKAAGSSYTSTTTLNTYMEILATQTGWVLVSNTGAFV